MKYALVGLMLVAVIAAAAVLPVRPYLDFQVIFHANLGLLRGISLYDHAGQVEMIAEMARVAPEQVYVLPFPYPPWYALSTLWLALLPIDLAARAWFAVSLALLLLSLWLLTSEQPPVRRALLVVAGLFWLPMLGGLFVGQYGFPVLLGATLMIHALRQENAVLMGLAAALLTFKPHLGGPVLLVVLIVLVLRGDAFARRALIAGLIAGVILFAVGYLASPRWPVEYAISLGGFKDVSQCGQCVSMPMLAARAAGGGFDQALWIAALAALASAAWLVSRWRRAAPAPDELVSMGILLTILVSPYVVNYDYLLLIVPFIGLARRASGMLDWVVLGAAYVTPWIGLAFWGTRGNNSLIAAAVLLFAFAATRTTAALKGGIRSGPA